jgi:hypothetical protein
VVVAAACTIQTKGLAAVEGTAVAGQGTIIVVVPGMVAVAGRSTVARLHRAAMALRAGTGTC